MKKYKVIIVIRFKNSLTCSTISRDFPLMISQPANGLICCSDGW